MRRQDLIKEMKVRYVGGTDCINFKYFNNIEGAIYKTLTVRRWHESGENVVVEFYETKFSARDYELAQVLIKYNMPERKEVMIEKHNIDYTYGIVMIDKNDKETYENKTPQFLSAYDDRHARDAIVLKHAAILNALPKTSSYRIVLRRY